MRAAPWWGWPYGAHGAKRLVQQREWLSHLSESLPKAARVAGLIDRRPPSLRESASGHQRVPICGMDAIDFRGSDGEVPLEPRGHAIATMRFVSSRELRTMERALRDAASGPRRVRSGSDGGEGGLQMRVSKRVRVAA